MDIGSSELNGSIFLTHIHTHTNVNEKKNKQTTWGQTFSPIKIIANLTLMPLPKLQNLIRSSQILNARRMILFFVCVSVFKYTAFEARNRSPLHI